MGAAGVDTGPAGEAAKLPVDSEKLQAAGVGIGAAELQEIHRCWWYFLQGVHGVWWYQGCSKVTFLVLVILFPRCLVVAGLH